MECPQFEENLPLIFSARGYELCVLLHVHIVNQYESDVYPCRCICTYNSIVVNSLASVNEREKKWDELSKVRNLCLIQSLSPDRWKPNLKFYLRSETCAQFDLHHRTGGNQSQILSKVRNLCLARSSSSDRWKPNLKFYLTENCAWFNLHHRTGGNLISNFI